MATSSIYPAYVPTWNQVRFYKRRFYKALYKNVPRSIKRYIFISATLALLKRYEIITEGLIKQINKLLSVTYDIKEYKSGYILKRFIWRAFKKDRFITTRSGRIYELDNLAHAKWLGTEGDELLDAFIEKMPCWLVYGSKEIIKHDLSILSSF